MKKTCRNCMKCTTINKQSKLKQCGDCWKVNSVVRLNKNRQNCRYWQG